MQTTLKNLATDETAHLEKSADGSVRSEMVDFRGKMTRSKVFCSVQEAREWFRNDVDTWRFSG